MMNKIFKTLFLITLFCFVSGFSDIKQKNEYSSAPVCAANCIINYNNFDTENLVEYFTETAKTDKRGTKTNNLCKSLEDYFSENNRTAYIKYFGIRPVNKRFLSEKPLDIVEEISNGRSVILNIGIYKKDGNQYIRQYGHFVNAVYVNDKGQILVTDPYAKESAPFWTELKEAGYIKTKHNKFDNERVLKKVYDYKQLLNIPYLQEDEIAFLNGVISINLIYF